MIWNGDLVANDIPYTYAEQNNRIRQIIRAFAAQMRQGMWATRGNHDDKPNRMTRGQLTMQEILYAEDIELLNYTHIWLKTQRGYAHVSHPKNYSKNSVDLGRKLYNVITAPEADTGGHTKPKFMVIGHTHQAQEGHSEDGWAEIYGLGCSRDLNQTAYKRRQVTKHPEWSQSFIVFVDGYVKVFDRKRAGLRQPLVSQGN